MISVLYKQFQSFSNLNWGQEYRGAAEVSVRMYGGEQVCIRFGMRATERTTGVPFV